MRPIAFYPQLARELGSVEAAIYYQQLFYWSDKGSRGDGFIYKTKEEIEEETTLTRRIQDRCREILEEKGWLETKVIKANGAPTVHYRPLKDIKISISTKRTNPIAPNALNLDSHETDESITETTQRIPTAIPSEVAPLIEKNSTSEVTKVPLDAHDGGERPPKVRVPRETWAAEKAVYETFAAKAKQHTGIHPPGLEVWQLKLIRKAMAGHSIQLHDLFDDWFLGDRRDEDILAIHKVFSAANLSRYLMTQV